MRTVRVVIGARRDQLDGIGSEYNQVAEILLPLIEVPAIVGIGFWAKPQLMAAQRIFRRRLEIPAAIQLNPSGRHL